MTTEEALEYLTSLVEATDTQPELLEKEDEALAVVKSALEALWAVRVLDAKLKKHRSGARCEGDLYFGMWPDAETRREHAKALVAEDPTLEPQELP